jgi:hypothetical protein
MAGAYFKVLHQIISGGTEKTTNVQYLCLQWLVIQEQVAQFLLNFHISTTCDFK